MRLSEQALDRVNNSRVVCVHKSTRLLHSTRRNHASLELGRMQLYTGATAEHPRAKVGARRALRSSRCGRA